MGEHLAGAGIEALKRLAVECLDPLAVDQQLAGLRGELSGRLCDRYGQCHSVTPSLEIRGF